MPLQPLFYNKRSMKTEPVGLLTMNAAATLLKANQPVMVCLEPGDMTRYDLLIVPCGGVGMRSTAFGYSTLKNGLFVHLVGEGSAVIPDLSDVSEDDFVKLDNNEWTRTFMAWWFGFLHEALKRA